MANNRNKTKIHSIKYKINATQAPKLRHTCSVYIKPIKENNPIKEPIESNTFNNLPAIVCKLVTTIKNKIHKRLRVMNRISISMSVLLIIYPIPVKLSSYG
jgi:hypothetical protein